MEALSRLVEARIQSRRQRGGSEEYRVGSEVASLQRPPGPTLQPTSVPPSGSEVACLHRVDGRRRPAGAAFVE